ncbi:MAG: hypothetical protein V4754_14665 [Pseudomonadota bacterium]
MKPGPVLLVRASRFAQSRQRPCALCWRAAMAAPKRIGVSGAAEQCWQLKEE